MGDCGYGPFDRCGTHRTSRQCRQVHGERVAMKLEAGKVAVVTGAASGIGLALAERFATSGVNVVLADGDDAGLAAAAEKIGAKGVDALTVRTDVSEEASVQALAAAAVARFGSVQVVCNN